MMGRPHLDILEPDSEEFHIDVSAEKLDSAQHVEERALPNPPVVT